MTPGDLVELTEQGRYLWFDSMACSVVHVPVGSVLLLCSVTQKHLSNWSDCKFLYKNHIVIATLFNPLRTASFSDPGFEVICHG